MVAEMDRLLNDYTTPIRPRILNEKGFKTGDGLSLTPIAVGDVRKAYGLKSRFDRLCERGLLTISEMAQACGVSINTLARGRQNNLIRAYAINDRAQFLLEDPGCNPPPKYLRKTLRKLTDHVAK